MYELFLLLTAEHTDLLIKRTDIDLIKAVSRAQWRVGKAWFSKVLTRAPQVIGCFSTKNAQIQIPKCLEFFLSSVKNLQIFLVLLNY